MKITGKFDIDIKPQDISSQGQDGTQLGRMSFNKTFFGELEASSKGEMLTAMTAVKGSAGYVAIEQVIGVLASKQGSFMLQHFGTMNNGKDQLVLEVIPDSGTGELVGLQGKMAISIEQGQHYYEFKYSLV